MGYQQNRLISCDLGIGYDVQLGLENHELPAKHMDNSMIAFIDGI